MSSAHLIDMAGIWFSHAFGNRNRQQKEQCERLGWWYLMQATMTELQP